VVAGGGAVVVESVWPSVVVVDPALDVVVESIVGSTLDALFDVVDDDGSVGFVIGAPTVVAMASSSPLHPVAVSSSVASRATARLVIAVW
jgi:hypothetical protein